ncbi:3',5'-cyclic-nucleotide phosphodiesterase, variant 2 [Mucor circinelloides]
MSPITPTTAHHCNHDNNKNSAYLPDRIHDRIKAINSRDINFTKAIIDSYLPAPSTITCKQLTDQHRDALQKKVSSWDFSPLNLSHDDLVHCSVIIISQLFLLDEITKFSQDQLYSFILDLANIYHDENPYHNFAHAVDVLQCIYYFTCQLGLVPFADGTPCMTNSKTYRILRPRDLFALFIAAIGHDTAHPGVNNAFLINTSAPLALLYNDNSVLESFHAMTLFQLLKKHKFDDTLGGSDSKEYVEFRKLVITSILATDMALHGDYVTKIKEQKQRLADSDPNDWDAPRCLEERLLFCSGLIKCADISNVARPFPRAYEWAQILIEEFASQGDLERELGLNVMPMNDRSQIILEDSQIGFIRFVAVGLFESVSEYMQELSFPVDHIKRNLSIWEDRKRENIENNHHTSTHQQQQQQQEDSNSSSDTTATAEDDYHSQAVAALSKKDDIDSGYTLPEMPATLAMSSFSSITTKRYQHEQDHHGDWDPRESSGPVYCSCNIM